jgi:hypothetical protein
MPFKSKGRSGGGPKDVKKKVATRRNGEDAIDIKILPVGSGGEWRSVEPKHNIWQRNFHASGYTLFIRPSFGKSGNLRSFIGSHPCTSSFTEK